MENDETEGDLVRTPAGAQLVHDVITALLKFSASVCEQRNAGVNAAEVIDAALCGLVTFFQARVREDAAEGVVIHAIRGHLEAYEDHLESRQAAQRLVQIVADEIGCVDVLETREVH